jgi:hypothetical protein
MNYKVKLVLTRIDPEGAPKAEELDREVEDAIKGIDIQGYEVNELRTRVDREGDESNQSEMDRIAQRIVMIKQLADGSWYDPMPGVGAKDPKEQIVNICNSMLDEWEADRRAQAKAKAAAKSTKTNKKEMNDED